MKHIIVHLQKQIEQIKTMIINRSEVVSRLKSELEYELAYVENLNNQLTDYSNAIEILNAGDSNEKPRAKNSKKTP